MKESKRQKKRNMYICSRSVEGKGDGEEASIKSVTIFDKFYG